MKIALITKKTRINVIEKCVLNFTRRADHAKNA